MASPNSVTLFDIGVLVPKSSVTVLIDILKKAKLHPNASTFPSARLIDDMKPLSFQVESVSNTVTKSLRKLTGNEDIKDLDDFEDGCTLDQLIERAEKNLELLESIKPESLADQDQIIKHPFGDMSPRQFILGFPLPNVFFHLQTAYAILRMKGVDLGKADYLNGYFSNGTAFP